MAHLLEEMRIWTPPAIRTYPAKDVEEVNLLINWEGNIKRLGKITFRADASLYIWIYGKTGKYFYGLEDFPPGADSHTFDFSKNCTNSIPHLSVHLSGQTHVRDHSCKKRGFLAGPVHLPHLSTFRGEHVASIVADDLQALPEFGEPIVNSDKRRDLVANVDSEVRSGRLIIFANALEPVFNCDKRPYLTIQNSGRGDRRVGPPIHYGIVALAQHPLGDGPGKGVLMLSGWNPTNLDRILYVRAQ